MTGPSTPLKTILSLFAAAILAGGFYLYWPTRPAEESDGFEVREFGERGDSAMILVEPALKARNYRRAEDLRAELARHLDEAKKRGWIDERSIIVFPEHIGTWLVAADAPALAYRSKSLATASLALIADGPLAFMRAWRRSGEDDRAAASFFRARGAAMARNYVEIFGSLARDYGATIVAGSIVLENPVIEGDAVRTQYGALYNVSAVFKPDGSIHPSLVFKRHPIPSETAFARAGARATPVFETPGGRLGVLICADSWHPEMYAELSAGDVETVAVPAFLQADDAWGKAWGGYVTPPPDDVAPSDTGRLTEGEAWRTYAMPARLASSGAVTGGAAFLHGDLWDLGADGRTLAVTHEQTFVGDGAPDGAVTVIWRQDAD
ncbi:MAG: carbon-nitrogen hydrolase family protein [Pseudomonadota bacterium]